MANTFQFVPKGLKLISSCPACGNRYSQNQAKVIEEKGDAHLVHIKCQKCQGGVVALIVHGGIGISSVGLMTDLTAEDVFKFKDARPLAEDDCIAIHETLEKNSII